MIQLENETSNELNPSMVVPSVPILPIGVIDT